VFNQSSKVFEGNSGQILQSVFVYSVSKRHQKSLSTDREAKMKFVKSAYSPPYDSPLEDDFAYNIFKLFDIDVRIIPQFEVKTICGTFRIDFVAETSSGLIGFECDG